MNDDFVFEILDIMEQNNVLLAFNGEFDMRVVNALVTSVKQKLTHVESNMLIQKRVYNVMVECLENIFRHSEDAIQSEFPLKSYAIFTLNKEEENYYLITGNYVQNKNVDFLKSTIDTINSLSKEERKDMYREILNNKTFSEKGGAGLGIIDIAIKADTRLEYDFKKVDDNKTFYIFRVRIQNNYTYLKN